MKCVGSQQVQYQLFKQYMHISMLPHAKIMQLSTILALLIKTVEISIHCYIKTSTHIFNYKALNYYIYVMSLSYIGEKINCFSRLIPNRYFVTDIILLSFSTYKLLLIQLPCPCFFNHTIYSLRLCTRVRVRAHTLFSIFQQPDIVGATRNFSLLAFSSSALHLPFGQSVFFLP